MESTNPVAAANSNPAGHWYAIASSRQVSSRPVGLTRFGEQIVLWRSADGNVVGMHDRCPHRGAALSLGRVRDGALACPFHGIAFGPDGRCTQLPVEPDMRMAEQLRAQPLPVHEEHDYIWLWHGTGEASRPAVPSHPDLAGRAFGESVSTWPAHYTRCIENVCDYSHLPFVHKTTIGLFPRNTVTEVDIEPVPHGFRAHLLKQGARSQCLEFLYPNLWMLRVSGSMLMSAVFAPVDERHTEVYGRTWHGHALPGLTWLIDAYTRFSHFLVFREDWPIVASQEPQNVANVRDEKLLPSDAPVIAYRKLRASQLAGQS